MKFLCERDALKDALVSVIGRTKSGSAIPILSHFLIEVTERLINITGNDLDSYSTISIVAEVTRDGSIAIPAGRLNSFVAGLPSGRQVLFEVDGTAAKVKSGRSAYSFSVLPASDFPVSVVATDAIQFTLTKDQAVKLFGVPAPCILQEETRYYLKGIYLHRRGDQILACATNGHMLIRTAVDLPGPEFNGSIVPEQACHEIAKLAGASGNITIGLSNNRIAVQAGDCRFASKLIDGKFPDYEMVIPQSAAPAMTVDADALDAALGRLVSAADPKTPGVVRLSWDNNPTTLTVSLRSEFAQGEEEVECNSAALDAGEVGAQLRYLRQMIESTGGDSVRFYANGPGRAMRIENPNDENFVAVLMPMRV